MLRNQGDGQPSFARRIVLAFNPHVEAHRDRSTPWAGFAAQVMLITAAALLYFAVRIITRWAESAAFANAEALLRFEHRIGIDIEPWAQARILDSEAIVTFFNWVYIWMHWPVIIGVLAWLYRFDKRGFVLFRNALIISGAIGLVFFVSYPVAPPRFLDGFSDTVADLSTSYRYLQSPAVVNKFAAMPSLHVGWNLLAGLVLFNSLRGSLVRFLPLISPVL
ncbi:MAG: phosphatase PAP2 family protein, partial [Acidimicrobiales bacterium]